MSPISFVVDSCVAPGVTEISFNGSGFHDIFLVLDGPHVGLLLFVDAVVFDFLLRTLWQLTDEDSGVSAPDGEGDHLGVGREHCVVHEDDVVLDVASALYHAVAAHLHSVADLLGHHHRVFPDEHVVPYADVAVLVGHRVLRRTDQTLPLQDVLLAQE